MLFVCHSICVQGYCTSLKLGVVIGGEHSLVITIMTGVVYDSI